MLRFRGDNVNVNLFRAVFQANSCATHAKPFTRIENSKPIRASLLSRQHASKI